jgi:hypothetical protein
MRAAASHQASAGALPQDQDFDPESRSSGEEGGACKARGRGAASGAHRGTRGGAAAAREGKK